VKQRCYFFPYLSSINESGTKSRFILPYKILTNYPPFWFQSADTHMPYTDNRIIDIQGGSGIDARFVIEM